MPSFKKNLASIYAVNIVNGVMGVALVPLSLKFLGAEGYGLFSIYTVIASFVALLDVGIGKSLQRSLSSKKNEEAGERQIATACGAYLIVLGALVLILPALLFIIPEYIFPVEKSLIISLRWIVALSCLEYVLFIPLAINQSICFSNEAFDKHAKFSLFSGIGRYAILFAAIYLCNSVVLVIGIYVLRRVFDCYLASRILGSLPKTVWKPQFHTSDLRGLGGHALGLSTTRLLQTILISMGAVLVNRSFGLESLGFFRAAFDLASKVWFVSNGIGLIAYPKFVKAFSDKNQGEIVFSRLRHAMLFSWLIYLLMGSLATGLSSFVLPQIKITQAEIISLFIPLVVGVCINAHANLGYEVIQAAGRYRILNLLTASSIILMLAVFVALKPRFGVMSVAWAWLSSQFIYAVATDVMALNSIIDSVRQRIDSILIRIVSFLLVAICVLVQYNDQSKIAFLTAFGLQIAIAIWCFSILKKRL